MKLEGTTGPLVVVEGGSEGELIQKGLLAEPHIKLLRAPMETFPTQDEVRDKVLPGWRANPRKLRTKGGAMFAEAYRRGITYNGARNALFYHAALSHAALGERGHAHVSKA